ncbi:MAG: amidohydrolase [bacterium]|nr:amidohydrolase [bacterium]
MADQLSNKVVELKDTLVPFRRDFHQHPELGLEETRTARVVADRLEQLGLKVF